MQSNYSLNEKESELLLKIIKKNFINLFKILHELDPKEGEIFQKNNHYYLEQDHDHDHAHDQNHSACSIELVKKFYIPEDKMTYF
jgi:hypothetical protein